MQGAQMGMDSSNAFPDAKKGTTPKTIRKIPRGMSEYQAAWIIDESDDEEGEGEGEDNEGSEVEMREEEQGEMVEIHTRDEDNEMESDSRRSVTFHDMDMEEEDRQYVSASLVWRPPQNVSLQAPYMAEPQTRGGR